jgi:hypothetical protein
MAGLVAAIHVFLARSEDADAICERSDAVPSNGYAQAGHDRKADIKRVFEECVFATGSRRLRRWC